MQLEKLFSGLWLVFLPCLLKHVLLPSQRQAVPAGDGVRVSAGCRQTHSRRALCWDGWQSSPGSHGGLNSRHQVPPSARKSSGLFLLCCPHSSMALPSSTSPPMSSASTPALSRGCCTVRSLRSSLGIFLKAPFLRTASVPHTAPAHIWQVGQA